MSNRKHYVNIIARDLKDGDVIFSALRKAPVKVSNVRSDVWWTYFDFELIEASKRGQWEVSKNGPKVETISSDELLLLQVKR